MKKHLSWLKKIIIFLGFLAILSAGFSFFLTPKVESNKKALEKEIEEIFSQQQSLVQRLSQLLQTQKFEEAKQLISPLKENNLKLITLHQQLDLVDKNNDLKNEEGTLENNLIFFEKIEACLNLYPEEKEAFQNCQKEMVN